MHLVDVGIVVLFSVGLSQACAVGTACARAAADEACLEGRNQPLRAYQPAAVL